jgi:Mitochondrial carrier protein
MMKTFKEIISTEGLFRGAFKGFSLNIVKGPIANGIAFATKNLVDRKIFHHKTH